MRPNIAETTVDRLSAAALLRGPQRRLPERCRAQSMWAAMFATFAALAVFTGGASRSLGAPPSRSPAWVPDGSVRSLLAVGETVFVAGEFSRLSAPQGSFAVFPAGRATPDGSVAQLRDGGVVTAIVADGHGGWFVGGSFQDFAGSHCPNLVHVDASGGVDLQWCPRVDFVQALARTGRTLYVAGGFSHIAGASDAAVAAFDTHTARVLPFRVRLGTSASIHPVTVEAMAATATSVFLAGVFASVNGHIAKRLAAVDARSGALKWSARPDGRADALALARDRLFVGGFFGQVNGARRSGVAALDPRTGRLLQWQPQQDLNLFVVYALAASQGAIYVGGRAATRGAVAAVSAQTGRVLWHGTYVGRDGPFAIARSGRAVIVAGSDLRALSTATGRPLAWHVRTDADVEAVAVSRSQLAAGGTFQSIQAGLPRQSLGALAAASGRPIPWAANRGTHSDLFRTPDIRTLAVGGDTLYAAGFFNQIEGRPREGLAAFDLHTGALQPWAPPVQFDCSSYGCALAAANDALYIAGDLTVRGQLLNAAAVDASTGTPLAWNPAPDDTVASLAVSGSTVYLGGVFTRLGGKQHPYLAAVDSTSGAPSVWQPRLDGPVTTIALQGTTLYVGGGFSHVGTVEREHLAAFDTTTGTLLQWNPRLPAGARGNSALQLTYPIATIVPSGSIIYIGGVFERIGGADRHNVAAVDAVTGNATAWSPTVAFNASTIAVTPGLIYIGGDYLGHLIAVAGAP